MREVRMPKLNNNDASYTLVEWSIREGGKVAVGDTMAVIETSKASEDLIADTDGILHQVVPERSENPFGELIGYLFDSDEQRLAFVATEVIAQDGVSREPVITAPAEAFMRELGLTKDDLRGLPVKVIKRSDVERIAGRLSQPAASAEPAEPAGQADRRVYPQSRNQCAVAAVVTQSHSTIPAAFVAVDVLDDKARAARRAHGVNVDITPLLLKALGVVRKVHPLCFGAYRDPSTVVVSDGAHVAVTVDGGHGLYLPVIRDVQNRSVVEIAEELDGLRLKARTGAYTEADLTGGNIGLSVHTYQGVVAAQPLITPGQVAMLSLCAPRPQLTMDLAGAISNRLVFQLGMAYDHRVINGRDAVVFLRTIKSCLERSDQLEALFR